MSHFHHCPYCYEHFECELNCTICPDLEDGGREFGSHAICHDVVCHIGRAIEKHNERYEQRQREALRRLQSPLQIRTTETSAGSMNVGTEKDMKYIIPGIHRRPIA